MHTRNVPGQKGFKSSRGVQLIKKEGGGTIVFKLHVTEKILTSVLIVCAKWHSKGVKG